MAKAKSAKSKTTKSKSTTSGAGFAASLAKVIASAKALQSAIAALDLPALTFEERLHSLGRLRDGEPDAMTAIFDTIDAFPAIFGTLAESDQGVDPDAVETGPARTSLAAAEALAPLAQILENVLSAVSDGVLANAGEAKALSIAAYAIGKANATGNAKLRKSLAGAIDFYGVTARKRAGNARKAAKPAAKASA